MGKVDSDYVSEHTRWMREQLAEHPEWSESQRQGRALWWDKPQTTEEKLSFASARVAQKAYPYDTNF